jgi:polyphosphate kinase 2 (PPK2 family)
MARSSSDRRATRPPVMSACYKSFAFRSGNSPATLRSGEIQLAPPSRARRSETRNQLGRSFAVRADRRVLVVLEAVNAGGKDGLIEELVSVLGDDDVRVERFRRPLAGDRQRDVLDEVRRLAPKPGELVFFNRSYYGNPVHAAIAGRDVTSRCERIVEVERWLADNGIVLVKLFLHIDKSEQFRRLEHRQYRAELRHLHNPMDYGDQGGWDDLMQAYDTVMSRTHTTVHPWLVIPSNDRAVRNHAVQDVLMGAFR